MGEILGLGLSHYPGPKVDPSYWPQHLSTQVERGRLPQDLFEDHSRWPEAMQAEWGDDEGQSSARKHHGQLIPGYRRLRQELDAFQPDLVVMWGDDQYENFRKDCVPPFCIFIEEQETYKIGKPPLHAPQNVWNLPPDTEVMVQCHKQAANQLTRHLLAEGFDVSYALEMRRGMLSHAFADALQYLDFDRKGWSYPLLPFHVNCYGNQLMTTSAGTAGESTGELSPPAPSPKRCFEIGRATARFFKASPWRTALVASSSWSHAPLTFKNMRLYPDIVSDRKRYEELASGDLEAWGRLTIDEIEQAGQHEILNWVCLAGAMFELGHKATHTQFVETYIFNSSKCFAVFQSAAAAVPA
jgi:hypothetical protein